MLKMSNDKGEDVILVSSPHSILGTGDFDDFAKDESIEEQEAQEVDKVLVLPE